MIVPTLIGQPPKIHFVALDVSVAVSVAVYVYVSVAVDVAVAAAVSVSISVAVAESYLNKVASLIRSRSQSPPMFAEANCYNAVLCTVHSVDRINSVS